MITCAICHTPLHEHESVYSCEDCGTIFTKETAEKLIWENPYFISKRDIHDKFIRRVEETSASISMAIVHTKLIDALSAKMLEESQEEESNAADKIAT